MHIVIIQFPRKNLRTYLTMLVNQITIEHNPASAKLEVLGVTGPRWLIGSG